MWLFIIGVNIVFNIIDSGNCVMRLPGDLNIGVLINIHKSIDVSDSIEKCSEIEEISGMPRMEAVLMTRDWINEDKNILPGINLGLEIRDTCSSANLALHQSLYFIRYTSLEDDSQQFSNQTRYPNQTTLHKKSSLRSEKLKLQKNHIVGVIGPAENKEIIKVQNFLKLFDMPQIGYFDTTYELSDRVKYPTFTRVLPCDSHQALVIRDILKKYNWTCISTIHTESAYSKGFCQLFYEMMEPKCNKCGICSTKNLMIPSNSDFYIYENIVRQLDKNKAVNVVICFCKADVLRRIFIATKKLNLTNRFTFIASDGSGHLKEITSGLEEVAWGTIVVHIPAPSILKFSEYYTTLKPTNNLRNPLFSKFWANKFNCTWSGDSIDSNKSYCTGNESIATYREDYSKIGFVIRAMWMMAHGLHNTIKEICGPNYTELCEEIYPFKTQKLVEHLMTISFDINDESVQVNQGNLEPRYEILNFQKLSDNNYDFVTIGEWENNTLTIRKGYQGKKYKPVISSCAKTCPLGHLKVFVSNNSNLDCCWQCNKCEEYEYVSPDKQFCIECEMGKMPNIDRTGCVNISPKNRNWFESRIIIVVLLDITGLMATLITLYTFVKYKETPIVKASNVPLSYLILLSIIISHISIFFYLATPTLITCVISRTIPPLAFVIMFAGLFTKIQTIKRILVHSKKGFPRMQYRHKWRFTQYSVVYCCAGIQLLLCLIMLHINPPQPHAMYPSRDTVVLSCAHTCADVIVPTVIVIILQFICTVYIIKTRNLPKNFNEARFMGFSILILWIIWISFFPIYFATNSKALTISMATTVTASMILVFLFFPKMYIIIFRPEKNTKALFITTKHIRAHVGSRVGIENDNNKSLFESPHQIISGSSDEIQGNNCRLRRNIGIQTSSELLRNIKFFYDTREALFLEQYYSSSDDEGDLNFHPDDPSTLTEFNKNIIATLNDNSKEIK